MTTNENNGGKGKRNRRTRLEVMAELKAKLAKLEAKVAGVYDDSQEDGYTVKRLKAAIRRRETAQGTAETLLNGRAATEKSPQVSPIDEKIANAEKRLADLRKAKTQAMETIARLPFDIEVLRTLLERANKGEAVEFPTGLYLIPGEKTDAEHEAASVHDRDN
jgi:uncharacterized protein (UPF0335 family)